MKCRLCGSSHLVIKHRYTDFNVLLCQDCTFLQVSGDTVDKVNREIYGESYFDTGKYENSSAGEKERKRRLAWMKKSGVPDGSRILEVGCGTGEFLSEAKRCFDVWGVDISEYAIETGKKNLPDISNRLFTTGIMEMPFEDNFFDAIVLWDTFEHLWDPISCMAKLVSLLKPGGIISLSTPNSYSLTARLLGKKWAFMTPPEHLSFYNVMTLERLCDRMGGVLSGWMSKGKWVNAAFLVYKLNRIAPQIATRNMVRAVRMSRLGKVVLYIPTGDVLYINFRFYQKKNIISGE